MSLFAPLGVNVPGDINELGAAGFTDGEFAKRVSGTWDGYTLPETWDFNFTANGDGYMRAQIAMTVALGGTIGTGTLAYAKSTNATPATFGSTTLPTALEAGAFLKVTVSAITGFVATQIVRTA